jgi:hypothetical protein
MTPTEPCVFCTARAAGSAEHVISKWISRLLWKVSPLTPQHGAMPPRGTDGRRPRIRRIIDLTTTAICDRCNNGWMSASERASTGQLTEAIFGRPFQIDSTMAVQLAAWCFMKALLAEAALREDRGELRTSWPAGLLADFDAFYWRRRPPVGAGVWLGHYDLPDSWPELVGRVGLSELRFRRRAADYTGCQMLFTIGHLLVIAVRWDKGPPDYFGLANSPVPTDALVRLWPVQSGHLDWPPAVVSYDQLGTLSSWTG